MRLIAHIDLNAFFAQVEMNRRPELKDKLLAVGGETRRGVVSTANYAARRWGVVSGMPLAQARRLCPELIVMVGDHARYRQESRKFFAEVRQTFPQLERTSIDECYVDATQFLTGLTPAFMHDKLRDFQLSLLNRTGLKCSLGVGANRFVAKMGSDLQKPLGITLLLTPTDIAEKLWPLPIKSMYGIGSKTWPKLIALGVETIGDLAHASSAATQKLLGTNFAWLVNQANGGGSNVIDVSAFNPKSCSSDVTLPFDTTDYEELRTYLLGCVKAIGQELRRHHKVTKTLCVKLRDADFKTVSKRESLTAYTDKDEDLAIKALNIFDHFYDDRPLRLVGCAAEDCKDLTAIAAKPEQLTLTRAVKVPPGGDK